MITIGIDLDEPLNALDLSRLASEGKLTFTTSKSLPMTDAQLDFLVTEWENNLKGSGTSKAEVEKNKQAVRSSKEFKDTEDTLRRSLGELKFTLSDVEDNEQVQNLRRSLDDAHGYISEREGLTDDELNEQIEILKGHRESLTADWSVHLDQHRSRIVGAIPFALHRDSYHTSSSTEPKLKLLRSSSSSNRADASDMPLMASADRSVDVERKGGGRYQQMSGSVDSTGSDYLATRGNDQLGGTAGTVSDFDFEDGNLFY